MALTSAPSPLRLTVTVDSSGSSDDMTILSLNAPAEVGAKSTVTAQLAAGASVWPLQPSSVTLNGSAGVETEVMTRSAVPSFFTVTVLLSESPTVTLPKSTEVGVTVMSGSSTTPVPVSVTSRLGVSGSSEVIVTRAVLPPSDEGVKTTSAEQLAPGASTGTTQVVDATSKSVSPVRTTFVTVRSAVPVFEMVTVCGAEVVPTTTLPKASVVGVTEMFGSKTVVVVPVPLSATSKTGVSGSSDGIESVPEAVPAAVGTKAALTVQVFDG